MATLKLAGFVASRELEEFRHIDVVEGNQSILKTNPDHRTIWNGEICSEKRERTLEAYRVKVSDDDGLITPHWCGGANEIMNGCVPIELDDGVNA